MAAVDPYTPSRAPVAPRTYGNWRRPASAGIGRLGSLGTAILLAGLIVVILTMLFAGLLIALGVAAVFGMFLLFLVVRDRHGASGLTRLATRIGWARARASGEHLYRSGPLGCAPGGTFRLPGLLAASTLSEWVDSVGRPFALLQVPATGHWSVVVATEPDGASLVDAEQVDLWVARWGQWLAALGNEADLVAASVTVETAPDTGTRLRREVETSIDAAAPAAALAMLREVVEVYPQGSASVRAWVALTFTPAAHRVSGVRQVLARIGLTWGRAARPVEAQEVARELACRLPGLTAGLAGTGAGATRPVAAGELCELVRVAYDPAAATAINTGWNAATWAGGAVSALSWDGVGPAAAQAGWAEYRHDSGVSVSWSMTGAPRGEVYSSVLAALLGPHPDIDRKRVTLTYRPMDAAVAARVVEADKRAAEFRASSTPRPTARMLAEQRSATATAAEEARGAGLVNFALLVTATVTDAARLPDARAAVDSLAGTARVQLRPVYGSQDSAFAAALPLGLVLPDHVAVPQTIREQL